MITYTITKKDEQMKKDVEKRIFDEQVMTIEPDRKENPYVTLKRILGNEFYDLLSDDLLQLNIEDEGTFDSECPIGDDLDKLQKVVNFIFIIYDGFAKTNGMKSFTPEFLDFQIKTAVSSITNGTEILAISLRDLYPILQFDKNDMPNGIRNFEEISTLVHSAEQCVAQSRKLGKNNLEAKAITDKIEEFKVKIATMNTELYNDFLKLIADKANVKVNDMYDIAFIFSFSVAISETEIEQQTIVVQYHDIANYAYSSTKLALGL